MPSPLLRTALGLALMAGLVQISEAGDVPSRRVQYGPALPGVTAVPGVPAIPNAPAYAPGTVSGAVPGQYAAPYAAPYAGGAYGAAAPGYGTGAAGGNVAVGSPYYWSNSGYNAAAYPLYHAGSVNPYAPLNSAPEAKGDPYSYHFGPGYYRSNESGNLRFPQYSYRRPWYYYGPPSYNRDTNLPW